MRCMKKIASCMCAISLIAGSLGISYASTDSNLEIGDLGIDNKTYEINSIKELESEINECVNDTGTDMLTEKEAETIISQTDPRVMEEYIDEQTDLVKDILKEETFSLDEGEFITEDVVRKEYNLVVDEETGAEIKVVLQDQSEPYETLASEGAQNKTGYKKTATKAVGDRYFTGTCYYQNGFVAIRLYVENHYTVTSSLGLKERYLTFKECQGMPWCDNTADYDAEGHVKSTSTVGKSIKYRIKIVSKLGPLPELGGNVTTKYYYCNSRVRLDKKNTADKTVDVTHIVEWV